MTLAEKKLWLLVAKKTGSNLEARMIYDELIKQLNMAEKSIMLSIVETEEGMEVHTVGLRTLELPGQPAPHRRPSLHSN